LGGTSLGLLAALGLAERNDLDHSTRGILRHDKGRRIPPSGLAVDPDKDPQAFRKAVDAGMLSRRDEASLRTSRASRS